MVSFVFYPEGMRAVMEVVWWAVVGLVLWLAFVDPFVIEPAQRRRRARKARAFYVGDERVR